MATSPQTCRCNAHLVARSRCCQYHWYTGRLVRALRLAPRRPASNSVLAVTLLFPAFLCYRLTNTHSYSALPIDTSVVTTGKRRQENARYERHHAAITRHAHKPPAYCIGRNDPVTLHHAIFLQDEVHGEICCKESFSAMPLT